MDVTCIFEVYKMFFVHWDRLIEHSTIYMIAAFFLRRISAACSPGTAKYGSSSTPTPAHLDCLDNVSLTKPTASPAVSSTFEVSETSVDLQNRRPYYCLPNLSTPVLRQRLAVQQTGLPGATLPLAPTIVQPPVVVAAAPPAVPVPIDPALFVTITAAPSPAPTPAPALPVPTPAPAPAPAPLVPAPVPFLTAAPAPAVYFGPAPAPAYNPGAPLPVPGTPLVAALPAFATDPAPPYILSARNNVVVRVHTTSSHGKP